MNRPSGKRQILRQLAAAGVVGAMALTAGCAGEQKSSAGGSLESMEPVVLRYSDPGVETTAHGTALEAFMDEVRAKTNGKVDFETYYSGTLHSATEALDAVKSGLTDISFVSTATFPDNMPAGLWGNGVAQSGDTGFPNAILEGTPVQMGMYEKDEVLRNELAAYDAEPLMFWNSVPFNILCNKPIETREQAAGLVARTGGTPWQQEVEALGMSNVFLPTADLYEGMQRGVIDCVVNPVSVFMTTGIWEDAKYYSPASFSVAAGSGLVVNSKVLAGLPLEARQIIFDARSKLVSDLVHVTLDRNVQWAKEASVKGVQYADPKALNAVLDPLRKERVAGLEAAAPDAVNDPGNFIAEFRAAEDHWATVVEKDLGIANAEPASSEEWIEAFRSVEDINWAEYEKAVQEYLLPYRP